MINTDKIVKIYDANNKLLGKGHLLNLSAGIIKVRGKNLPIIDSKTKVIIEIYNEISGIYRYHCLIRLASYNQLNAVIENQEPLTERRRSLKIRTDLSFYIETLYRNDEDITKSFPNMIINMLNLSVGGMLISSNYELLINDILTFTFICDDEPMLMKAEIIRIDEIYDSITNKLSSLNYGCIFVDLPPYYENIITKYLFKRQLSLYRDKKEQK
jgi:hypothetical protein